jgi:ferredoxin
MPTIKFVKEKVEIEVPSGACLRTEAKKAGINLNQGVNGIGARLNRFMNCKGLGLCGTCRVLITKGMEHTNPLTAREKIKFGQLPWVLKPIAAFPDPIPCLAYVGHEADMRLACMTQVRGDIEVESGPELNLFGENFFS